MGLILTKGGLSKPCAKVSSRSQEGVIPGRGSTVPLVSFLKWVAVLGALIFGSRTIWFFMTAHRELSVGFLVAAILFSVVCCIAASQLTVSN
jgi:hypothetical protein